MKNKTKLIATLMAICLVVTLGVFGILAVKTLNMSVCGNITFSAEGIAFEVSKGEFKTTSGSEYTGITTQTGKLQAFAMDTNTKQSDVQDKINSWAGLDLVATESLGDPVLHFSITNKMEDEILSFDPSITLGTNINNNMEIKIDPAVANIQPLQEEDFTITFRIIDKSINAGLTGENYSGFAIDILLSTALVAEPSEMPQMTFAPTATDSNKYVVSNCSSATGDVVIPSFVKVGNTNHPITEIADRAFTENTDITSITIPNTVTRIGDGAFQVCRGLSGELVIPNSVTTIGDYAFEACSALTSVVIPNSVTTIGDYVFSNCSGLSGELVIPNSVTSIGEWAFYYCSGLTNVVIGNSVTTIGGRAFDLCLSLTSVVIPNSVTTIGDSAFEECEGLTSVVIGNSVTTIGDNAFDCCNSLTSVVIPNSVTIIGEGAFRYSRLTSVVIPNGVTTIKDFTFEGCYELTSVVVGSSVTSISASAFLFCSKLTSITIKATTPPIIGADAFDSMSINTIYVPAGSVNAYKAATNWSVYADRIFAIA